MGTIKFECGPVRPTATLIVKAQPIEVIRGLQDQEVFESESAQFFIEISRVIEEFHWFKKGHLLEPGEDVIVSRDDRTYNLELRNCQISDMGTIRFEAGPVKPTATLIVKGSTMYRAARKKRFQCELVLSSLRFQCKVGEIAFSMNQC
ncbi:PREDICTED: obscurin-like [Branchiostoma belcheri]|uniref:Obscurin-like n=1 Tax=Branchiostoma belcheri TaxID=7741 RepID=A0A6P4YZF7_BRABE|nr:PREDICTED: obscurin-like [Branchiostoma belcheri]